MSGRLEGKAAIVTGAGQTPGEGLGLLQLVVGGYSVDIFFSIEQPTG